MPTIAIAIPSNCARNFTTDTRRNYDNYNPLSHFENPIFRFRLVYDNRNWETCRKHRSILQHIPRYYPHYPHCCQRSLNGPNNHSKNLQTCHSLSLQFSSQTPIFRQQFPQSFGYTRLFVGNFASMVQLTQLTIFRNYCHFYALHCRPLLPPTVSLRWTG